MEGHGLNVKYICFEIRGRNAMKLLKSQYNCWFSCFSFLDLPFGFLMYNMEARHVKSDKKLRFYLVKYTWKIDININTWSIIQYEIVEVLHAVFVPLVCCLQPALEQCLHENFQLFSGMLTLFQLSPLA